MSTLNPIKVIKKYFEKIKSNSEKRDQIWIDQLSNLGFSKVSFPIIIKDRKDLDIVYELRDFATDPDYYYHEFPDDLEFIDSKGQLFSWRYSKEHKTNLPGTLNQTLTIDQVRNIINEYFKGTRLEQEVKESIDNISNIEKIVELIADKV